MITKTAKIEEILEVKSSSTRLPYDGDILSKVAALNLDENDGYLYVRCRAISSRVNKNNDGWPSEELAASYKTFQGRPIFVDHNNSDPSRTRGVIVSSMLHVDDDKTSALDPYYATAPDNHQPPTWIELVLEVDAKTYPKFAEAIRKGDIDSVSMGANIELSKCSVCGNEATTPADYCNHIKQKGITFEITSEAGERVKKKSYEDCYGITFFEISGVFDPADETALISEKRGHEEQAVFYPIASAANLPVAAVVEFAKEKGWNSNQLRGRHLTEDEVTEIRQRVGKIAALPAESLIEPYDPEASDKADDRNYKPQDDMITAPQKVDTLRDDVLCPNCHSDHMATDPDGIQRCPTCGYIQEPEPLNNPDLSQAQDMDLRQLNDTPETNIEGQPQTPTAEEGDNLSEVTINPMKNVSPVGSSYILHDSYGRIDDMDWTVTLETTSRSMADRVLPAKASTVEAQIGFEEGINFSTHLAFKQAGVQAEVRYPVDGDNTNTLPGNPLKDFLLTNRSLAALGLDSASEIPVKVTSTDLEGALALIQSGGNPKEAAAQKGKKALLTGTSKATTEPKDQKIVSDQLAPVTSKLEELRERLAEIEEQTKEADRRHIKREVREEGDGGVTRSEEIVEESGDYQEPMYQAPQYEEPLEDEDEDEEDVEVEDQVAVAASTAEKKLLSIFALADEAVDMGVKSREEKMVYIASLEEENAFEIEGRKKMLEEIKQAGLTKPVSRTAHSSGVNRVPRLSHNIVSNNGNGSLDSIPDEAIFS